MPLAIIALGAGYACFMGWHRLISFDTLVSERDALGVAVAAHPVASLMAYLGIYTGVVGLGLPGGALLTLAGGLLFGVMTGSAASLVGATAGSTIIFLVTRTAFGCGLARDAGALAARLSEGFRRDAFHYLLVLRLIPLFPFYLVNIVPALCNVRLRTFLLATMLGMIPGTLAFAVVGAGLDDVVRQQATLVAACRALGRGDCHPELGFASVLTPRLIVGLMALAVLTLLPVLVRWWRNARDPGTNACAVGSDARETRAS